MCAMLWQNFECSSAEYKSVSHLTGWAVTCPENHACTSANA